MMRNSRTSMGFPFLVITDHEAPSWRPCDGNALRGGIPSPSLWEQVPPQRGARGLDPEHADLGAALETRDLKRRKFVRKPARPIGGPKPRAASPRGASRRG